MAERKKFLDVDEEIFDIYDNNNQETGTKKLRSVVHAGLKDWHRTTHIWIVNDRGEFLCQKRSMKKDSNPGKWQSFFGGHLKSGQTYQSNSISELHEELGLNITVDELKPVRVGKDEDVRHFGQVYVVHWNGDVSDVHFDDGEVEQVRWINSDQLRNEIAAGKFCNGIDETVLNFLATN